MQGLHYLYPEEGGVGAVDVNGHDLQTLQDMEFVNDKIMDYYSIKIKEKYSHWKQTGRTNAKIHFFNAFFFKKLTEHSPGYSLESTQWVCLAFVTPLHVELGYSIHTPRRFVVQ